MTDRAGAALFGKVPLPAQASIDIDLSWKNKPDFLLAFGASGAEENTPAAGARAGQTSVAVPYSIATLNMSLIACRETTQDADIAQLRTLTSGAGQLHLHVYIDQERGQMLVYAENGKLLGDLAVADAKPRLESGIRIVNRQGDLRLERLRVSRGSAGAPRNLPQRRIFRNPTDRWLKEKWIVSMPPKGNSSSMPPAARHGLTLIR